MLVWKSFEKKIEAVNGEFFLKNPAKKHQFDTPNAVFI